MDYSTNRVRSSGYFVVLILILGNTQILASHQEGDPCSLRNGERGQCRRYSHCKAAAKEDGPLVFCDVDGARDIVCCKERSKGDNNYEQRYHHRKLENDLIFTTDHTKSINDDRDSYFIIPASSSESSRTKHSIDRQVENININDGKNYHKLDTVKLDGIKDEVNRWTKPDNDKSTEASQSSYDVSVDRKHSKENRSTYREEKRYLSPNYNIQPVINSDERITSTYDRHKPQTYVQLRNTSKNYNSHASTELKPQKISKNEDDRDKVIFDSNSDWHIEQTQPISYKPNPAYRTTTRRPVNQGTYRRKPSTTTISTLLESVDKQKQNSHSYIEISKYPEAHTLRPPVAVDNGPDPFHVQRPRPTSERPKPIVATVESYNHRPTSKTTTRRPVEKLRISQIKCREYSQSVRETISVLPLTADPKPVEFQVNKCNYNAQTLIVGGQNATVGEFPHMAALGFIDRSARVVDWQCGGTLISENFVLTAAHCLVTSKGTPTFVRLGELNLKRTDDGAHPMDYLVKEAIRHPNYTPPIHYDDIALLRLAQSVKFTKHIRPACLYQKNSYHANKVIATGWGRTSYTNDQSDVLLKVLLSVVDNQKCNGTYMNSIKAGVLEKGILNSQMCAGDTRGGGKDTCKGDSGGPIGITSHGNQCIHHVMGVTSFGHLCGFAEFPGVYTRVSTYIPWIESHVWPENDDSIKYS